MASPYRALPIHPTTKPAKAPWWRVAMALLRRDLWWRLERRWLIRKVYLYGGTGWLSNSDLENASRAAREQPWRADLLSGRSLDWSHGGAAWTDPRNFRVLVARRE